MFIGVAQFECQKDDIASGMKFENGKQSLRCKLL